MQRLGDHAKTLRDRLEADRAKLYAKYGGNPPFEDRGEPPCSACKGAGHVLEGRIDPLAGVTTSTLIPCERCREGVEARERRKLIAARQSGLESKESVRFDLLQPLDGTEDEWNDAIDYAVRPRGFLVLSGDVYRGKTTIAYCIANEWLSAGKLVLFRDVPRLLDELRAGYDHGGEATYNELLKSTMDVPCLLLDDYGQENTTAWAREKLFIITNHRLENDLPTVITTNVTMAELEARDRRLYARLADTTRTTVLEFTNDPVVR